MSWTNSFYCSEYELAIFRKGVESGRKALRNKIQSLQAELEAVNKLLKWCYDHGTFDKLRERKKADWSFEMWKDELLKGGE